MIFSENNKRRKKIIILLLAFIAISIFSFLIGQRANNINIKFLINRNKLEKHEGGYKFINPLLECEMPVYYDNTLKDLEKSLTNKIDEIIDQGVVSHVSVYLKDLNDGSWIGINENENFTPASLMKVSILMYYLKRAESNPEILSQNIKITIKPEQTTTQNIIPLEEVTVGEDYSVEELLERMIIFSDNIALDNLLGYVDSNQLVEFYRDLSFNIPSQETENYINVHDYAVFFRILFNSSYLNRDMSEKALSILSQTKFSDGLVSGVPPNIVVSHKFGERLIIDQFQLHDCGIIYNPGRPYLLCVMTRGENFDNIKKMIQEISAISFDYFSLNK